MAQINPFQGPINYAIDVQSPFESALSGFKIGAAGAEIQAQAQERERKQQFQTGLKTFFDNPSRTYEDLEKLLPFADKQQFEALTKVGESMDKRRLETDKRVTAQTLIALEQNPSIAKTMLQERFDAETDPNQKRALGVLIETVNVDPKRAAQMIELTGAATFGKDWYSGITANRQERRTEAKAPAELQEAIAKADKAVADATTAQATATNAAERAAADAAKATADAQKAKVQAQYAERVELANLEKTGWDVKNLKSQIGDRAARLNLDQQTTAATVAEKLSSIQKNLNDIPADTRKLINEAAVTAATSKQSADQFNDLAKRLEAEGGGYGAFSSASDFLKKGIGFQGGMTQLRQEYIRLRNTAAIKSLPPGPATDKDISLALKGFPGENASASDLSSFLRGMAKLQDIDASVANAKTDWLAQNNGTLTRAKNTFVAGDYSAKPGETFNDFSQRVVQDVSKRYQPGQQSSLVQQIPTDRNPAPMAAQQDIRSQADAILRGGK